MTPLLSTTRRDRRRASTFEDVTRSPRCRTSSRAAGATSSSAYEELQSTIDELETTNEELQSANEELQTTNEELQSTNEELETMNEELQSTNEELETINGELRERTGELNQVNEFLEAILTSLGVGVAVLDRAARVQVWNRPREDLWGLRAEEAVDQHFLALDIGLPRAAGSGPARGDQRRRRSPDADRRGGQPARPRDRLRRPRPPPDRR